MNIRRSLLLALPIGLLASLIAYLPAEESKAPKPLKALLVLGGCCHDYAKQQDLLKEGIESRANVSVDILYSPDTTTKPHFPDFERANWAEGYDIVIHDECAADVMDRPYVDNIVNAHKAGLPAVVLHCAMHSFRKGFDVGNPIKPGSEQAIWFDFLGIQSNRHGPKEPINISFVDKEHAITKGIADWTTANEELYNNIQPPTNFPGHHSLAKGKQTVKNKDGTTKDEEAVIIWTNEYGDKKARVFGTTLGHQNETVGDARYLDLITRGLLWAAGKLGADGKPVEGYAPVAKK